MNTNKRMVLDRTKKQVSNENKPLETNAPNIINDNSADDDLGRGPTDPNQKGKT